MAVAVQPHAPSSDPVVREVAELGVTHHALLVLVHGSQRELGVARIGQLSLDRSLVLVVGHARQHELSRRQGRSTDHVLALVLLELDLVLSWARQHKRVDAVEVRLDAIGLVPLAHAEQAGAEPLGEAHLLQVHHLLERALPHLDHLRAVAHLGHLRERAAGDPDLDLGHEHGMQVGDIALEASAVPSRAAVDGHAPCLHHLSGDLACQLHLVTAGLPHRIFSHLHEREWLHARRVRAVDACGGERGRHGDGIAAGKGVDDGHRGRGPEPQQQHEPLLEHAEGEHEQLAEAAGVRLLGLNDLLCIVRINPVSIVLEARPEGISTRGGSGGLGLLGLLLGLLLVGLLLGLLLVSLWRCSFCLHLHAGLRFSFLACGLFVLSRVGVAAPPCRATARCSAACRARARATGSLGRGGLVLDGDATLPLPILAARCERSDEQQECVDVARGIPLLRGAALGTRALVLVLRVAEAKAAEADFLASHCPLGLGRQHGLDRRAQLVWRGVVLQERVQSRDHHLALLDRHDGIHRARVPVKLELHAIDTRGVTRAALAPPFWALVDDLRVDERVPLLAEDADHTVHRARARRRVAGVAPTGIRLQAGASCSVGVVLLQRVGADRLLLRLAKLVEHEYSHVVLAHALRGIRDLAVELLQEQSEGGDGAELVADRADDGCSLHFGLNFVHCGLRGRPPALLRQKPGESTLGVVDVVIAELVLDGVNQHVFLEHRHGLRETNVGLAKLTGLHCGSATRCDGVVRAPLVVAIVHISIRPFIAGHLDALGRGQEVLQEALGLLPVPDPIGLCDELLGAAPRLARFELLLDLALLRHDRRVSRAVRRSGWRFWALWNGLPGPPTTWKKVSVILLSPQSSVPQAQHARPKASHNAASLYRRASRHTRSPTPQNTSSTQQFDPSPSDFRNRQ